jgi:biofilm PGA synthesis N-glycosyltransferase PgaC
MGAALIQILSLWVSLFSIFVGGYGIYFALLRFYATKSWKLRIEGNFTPTITILIPARNEEEIIESKLENIDKVSYPKEKMEVILADDASTDGTLSKVYDFSQRHPELNIKVVKQNPRVGKARVLNTALLASTNDIIIVSDADSFWPSDILLKALPYLSDPTIGAITASGVIDDPSQSWVTRGETNYLNTMRLLRLGESKIYSTIRFEGGFCAYRRSAFERFDDESGSDDSGTALYIVQNKFRTIFVPETTFTTNFPNRLKDKIRTKTRRANHLIWLWIKCLKLLLERRLFLPKRIAIPEIFLFIFNPIVFLALIIVTVVMTLLQPLLLILWIPILLAVSLIPKLRSYFIGIALDNFILFYSLLLCVRKKRFLAWD